MNQAPKFSSVSRGLNHIVLLVICALTLGSVAASFRTPGTIRQLDRFFYDRFMVSLTSDPVTSRDIVIVDIDETSLSAAGQWPWPRYRIAQLLITLFAEHPKAMALDIIFPEPDRLSLARVAEQFKADFQLDLAFDNVPDSLTDNDGFFGHILGQTHTVGARYFYFDHFSKNEICKAFPFDIDAARILGRLPRARDALCNTVTLETRLDRAGFINNQYDSDGLLRTVPLLIRNHDSPFPHLALALFMAEQGIAHIETEKDRIGYFLRAGDKKIPVTREGFAHIRFSGPAGGFPYISAIDILNRNFNPDLVRGKTILIGSSAVGLNDLHPVVTDPHFPGIEVSALLLDNIHRNAFIRVPDWDARASGLLCLFIGLSMAAVFQFRPTPMVLLSTTLAWTTALVFSGAVAFWAWGIYISPAIPGLLATLLFILLIFIRFTAEKQAAFVWFRQLSSAQQLTMEIMVNMVETRDPETGEHVVRTQHYARAVAEQLRKKGLFTEILTDEYIHTLFLSVPLHDIGKVGIPDNILLKPARLTDNEFRHMKLHAIHGKSILHKAAQKIEGSNYLAMGEDIAGTHHEKWNGQGYPRGLAGEDIPLSGRIMAIADVYDALISKRCYKPPFPHEKAMAIILEEKGRLFDPLVVEAFVEIEDHIMAIAKKFRDE